MNNSENNPPINNPEKSPISQWLKITIIAIINILILAFLSYYFKDQQLNVLDVISLIADSMGIVIGLLGIWFYFISEQLNRNTAINLEKTTSTVNELRVEMWGMINKTFNSLLDKDNKEKIQETEATIDQLREKLDTEEPASKEIMAELEKIRKQVFELANSNRNSTNFVTSSKIEGYPLIKNIEELLSKFGIIITSGSWSSTTKEMRISINRKDLLSEGMESYIGKLAMKEGYTLFIDTKE